MIDNGWGLVFWLAFGVVVVGSWVWHIRAERKAELDAYERAIGGGWG